MYTKQETLELLKHLMTAQKENNLVTPEQEQSVSYRINLKTICENKSAEEAYKIIGSLKSVTVDDDTEYQPFKDIYYREDCYDYLISIGLSADEAESLTYIIRTGRYGFEKKQILRDKLPADFFDWAVTVKFLTSRIHFFKVFYREYEEYKYVNKYPLPQKGKTLSDAEGVITKYSSSPEKLYTDGIIKGKSSMLDKNGKQIVVTDYIAKKLLETDLLEKIKPVEMPVDKTYIVESHTGKVTTEHKSSNREEERTAMDLFRLYKYDEQSKTGYFFADYQTPICRSTQVKEDESQHIGKIDLIYVSRYEEMIYLTEFKRFDNEESLLRCVTEIYTYYKQVDKLRLAKEVSKRCGIEFIADYKVVPAVLVYEGQLQHLQFRSSLFTNVQKLMQKLGVKFFIIHSDKKHNEEGFFEAKNNFGIYELPLTVMNPVTTYQKSSLQKELDKAILRSEKIEHPNLTSGYVIGDRTFDEYLSNESFKEFLLAMPEDIKTMYDEGSGSELEERKNKHGVVAYPPKMASFSSSSRFIYNLMKHDDNFKFEKQLATTVGGTANLDGYLDRGDIQIFIEAKCREPYGIHANKFKTKYRDFYEYLNRSDNAGIHCDMHDFNEEKQEMKVDFCYGEEKISRFDIKQMLSHLLGIGTAILKNEKHTDKPIRFLYLIYNPELLEFENEEIKKKICNIYYQTCNEAEATISSELFKTVLLYLKEKHYPYSMVDIDIIANHFSFGICSQENFTEKLKERN